FFLTSAPAPRLLALSLHDALPIYQPRACGVGQRSDDRIDELPLAGVRCAGHDDAPAVARKASDERSVAFRRPALEQPAGAGMDRSEEHTSELQSRFDLVCRLLLEK